MKTVTITLQVESIPVESILKELQDNLLHSIRDTLLTQGLWKAPAHILAKPRRKTLSGKTLSFAPSEQLVTLAIYVPCS